MSAFAGILALVAVLAKSAPAAGAGLALVLAVDVSASVTADSYLLQRNGIARAFENPRLAGAISAVPGGIEALVLEWSDPDRIAVKVGWKRIADANTAVAFAAAVRATKRSSEGLTAIGPALLAAALYRFAAKLAGRIVQGVPLRPWPPSRQTHELCHIGC